MITISKLIVNHETYLLMSIVSKTNRMDLSIENVNHREKAAYFSINPLKSATTTSSILHP
jgi:hypothetical protein